jgi:hypothetical protein
MALLSRRSVLQYWFPSGMNDGLGRHRLRSLTASISACSTSVSAPFPLHEKQGVVNSGNTSLVSAQHAGAPTNLPVPWHSGHFMIYFSFAAQRLVSNFGG